MASPPDPQLRPAVRALDVQRATQGRARGIVLTDRLGLSEPTFLPEALLPIVGRCDGTKTLAEIRRLASHQVGEDVPLAFVEDLVRQLDERLLLVGERFAAAVAAAAAAFAAAGVRPARHAGSAGYPAEPEALRAALAALVGPTTNGAPRAVREMRGLVAPHIDLARGAAGYAAAYARLAAAPPADLYVVFGTGHAGPGAPVTGLALDWETPLGRTATDRGFVAAVHDAIGAANPADVLHHRDEHSLEFQVLFLQHLHERCFGGRPFEVACFLCGALPSASGDPLAEAWCQRLLAAFRGAERAAKKRVCWIAGADLAHIGPFFGDDAPVGDARLATLAAAERERLALLQRGAPGAFHAAVDCAQNPDRVCSAPAITLCAELAGGNGELLHYGQARADDGSQCVSYCAMAFDGP
jgi:AmmeMemoRadiSam system protein B